MFTSIFGIVVVVNQISEKDQLGRNKYMAMWKWESVIIAKIIGAFPVKVT